MIEKKCLIQLPGGLQARKATEFVNKASSFTSDIYIKKDDRTVAGKSIMGIMALAIRKGEEVILLVEGSDELAASTILEDFLSGQYIAKRPY